jgi:hypothetical protein
MFQNIFYEQPPVHVTGVLVPLKSHLPMLVGCRE